MYSKNIFFKFTFLFALLALCLHAEKLQAQNESGQLRDTSKKSIPLPSRESWITSEGVTLRFAPGLFNTMDPGYRATVVIPLDKIAPLLTDEGKDYMNPTLANKLTNNK